MGLQAREEFLVETARISDYLWFAFFRTPLLTPDTVLSLLDEGKGMKQIAQVFFADYRTIKKLVR